MSQGHPLLKQSKQPAGFHWPFSFGIFTRDSAVKYHLSVPEEGAAAVIPMVGSSPRAPEPSALSTCQMPKAEVLTYFSVSVIFTLQLSLWPLRQEGFIQPHAKVLSVSVSMQGNVYLSRAHS